MQTSCTSRQCFKNAQNLIKTELIVLVKNRKDQFCTSGYIYIAFMKLIPNLEYLNVD